jgi:hypothetical protein
MDKRTEELTDRELLNAIALQALEEVERLQKTIEAIITELKYTIAANRETQNFEDLIDDKWLDAR